MHGQARVRERTLELQKLRQFGRGRLAPYVSRRFDVSEPRERLPNLRVKKIAQVDKERAHTRVCTKIQKQTTWTRPLTYNIAPVANVGRATAYTVPRRRHSVR